VPQDTAIIETLRRVRKAGDTLSHLREGSMEARAQRIQEALQSEDFAAGPANLLYTYPRHALCERNGVVMRVAINEANGTVQLGNVEVHQLPEKVADIGHEVMETAKLAIGHILDEDYENASPLVASIANALSCGGDLKRQVESEVAKRSIKRDAWWHKVVAEAVGAGTKVEIPGPGEGDDALGEAITALKVKLNECAVSTAQAITALADQELPTQIESAAMDIAADLKYAIQALNGVNMNDVAEMAGIYEGVAEMAGHLVLGAQFLQGLVTEDVDADEDTGVGEEADATDNNSDEG